MDVNAQIIVALGFAFLLVSFGGIGLIWAIRCKPDKPHYRLPGFVAVSIPAAASLAWAIVNLVQPGP
jgi:hypothetical protein